MRSLTLYFGFFCQQFWRRLIREHECEDESAKCFVGINLSFLYCIFWNKDFKWFLKSNSNTFKCKQFNFFHLQTDRQTALSSHDFSWTFFFFSWIEKKILKAWVLLVSQLQLTKTSISSANVVLILFSMFFFHVLSFFCSYLFFLQKTRDKCDSVYFLLLVTRMSELSQKYDYYPLLICINQIF